jgi:hypothetical protein
MRDLIMFDKLLKNEIFRRIKSRPNNYLSNDKTLLLCF